MELIRDIANELDVDILCHKILVNVSILTNSDRGSLFLAKGPRGSRYLVAKLFDVTPDSVLQDALDAAVNEEGESRIPPIPFGKGIAGHVALTKENVNIKDAYQVRKFSLLTLTTPGKKTLLYMTFVETCITNCSFVSTKKSSFTDFSLYNLQNAFIKPQSACFHGF